MRPQRRREQPVLQVLDINVVLDKLAPQKRVKAVRAVLERVECQRQLFSAPAAVPAAARFFFLVMSRPRYLALCRS